MRTIWSATRRGNWAVSLPKFFKNLFSCSVTPSYNHVPLENSPTRKYQLVMTLWRCNANGRKKTLYAFYKTHWCKSRQFLGVQRKSCPKLLYYVFIYHVAIDWKMENLVLDIWFLIIQLKKYARLCKNIVRSQLAQYYWGSVSKLWGFPFTFQLLLSARNLRPSWGRSNAASFSEDIYVIFSGITRVLSRGNFAEREHCPGCCMGPTSQHSVKRLRSDSESGWGYLLVGKTPKKTKNAKTIT